MYVCNNNCLILRFVILQNTPTFATFSILSEMFSLCVIHESLAIKIEFLFLFYDLIWLFSANNTNKPKRTCDKSYMSALSVRQICWYISVWEHDKRERYGERTSQWKLKVQIIMRILTKYVCVCVNNNKNLVKCEKYAVKIGN